jgi:tripeptidyl-peptidase I
MKLLPLVSLSLALLSQASPAPFKSVTPDFYGPHATKHAWTEIPPKWKHLGPAPDSHTIRLRLGLKQSNIDTLVNHLYEVSDPNHVRYGMHLSKEQVEDLVRPDPESVELVETWLAAHDLDIHSTGCGMERSPAGDWISLNVPVRLAEQMLDTQYNVYQHNEDPSNIVVRTLSYSLPRSLHDHIDVVTPTTYFGTMRAMRSTAFLQPAPPIVPAAETDLSFDGPSGFSIPASCNTTITPDCLMRLYGTYGYKPVSTKKNKIGIAGYLEEYANYADLKVRFLVPFNLF